MPSSHTVALIKGYLPLRLLLPNDEHTFLFVKEHASRDDESAGKTLFVANAPFVGGSTRRFLVNLFGRYGDIHRVTVISNPRNHDADSKDQGVVADMNVFQNIHSTGSGEMGKFAHVVYETTKDLKRAIKSLRQIMSSSANREDDDDDDDNLPGIKIGKLELQQARIETQKNKKKSRDDDQEEELTGILAVAAEYRRSIVPHAQLMEACNAVMNKYEKQERQAANALQNAGVPDEDGFITVVSSHAPTAIAAAAGTKRSLEQHAHAGGGRGNKRKRKKKKALGSSELSDFYRFQRKDERKKALQELRKRFEEDVAKVNKLKQEKQYRPF